MNKKVIAIGVGTLFSYSISMASNIVIKLANNDLKIKGELSINESKPFVISGFDNYNKPFKLTIETKP